MRSAKLVTTLIATLAAGAMAASPASAASCAGADARPASDNLDGVRATTLCLINAERAEEGLPALAADPLLTRASDAYAETMVRQRFFAHVSPDGQTLVDRLTAVGYLGRSADWLVGENIAWADGRLSTPRQVMVAWMDSPGHRANILEPRFREVGLGVALGSPRSESGTDAATYTTDFGKIERTEYVVPRVETASARPGAKRSRAKSTSRAKRKCPRGRRLVVKRQGKRVVRRCVHKRPKRR